jgi:PAS domain S-box-containing protein
LTNEIESIKNKKSGLGRRRNQAEEKLLSFGKELFDIFLEASEDLIFLLDEKGCFIKVNDYGAASIDYEARELIGRHFTELVILKDRRSVSKSFQSILGEDKIITFETRMISKFGSEVLFEINGKTIRRKEKITGMFGVGRNITVLRNYEERISALNTMLVEAERLVEIERKRSKRQKSFLDELNRMKSEFVSNISHELRTPLASIIGFSETIASDPNMPQEMKSEFNNIILNEGKRLAKLINDILDISRIEGGQLQLNKAEFDIAKLLNEVIESNRVVIKEKGLSLTKEIPSDSVIVNADKERMTQVFNGLLNNAIKFTNPKGRIAIIAQTLYKEFEVVISDTGIGIPKRDLPYIFQKFYRVSRPGTEIPGTGLGLVFVKQVIDMHKGYISVQSEVDKGTTVIVKLPKN